LCVCVSLEWPRSDRATSGPNCQMFTHEFSGAAIVKFLDVRAGCEVTLLTVEEHLATRVE
jgi:hypothetical protein